MALNSSNNYLQDLISAGNDAHSNLFEIVFTGGSFSDDIKKAMSVRVGSFTPPDITQDKYTVKYVTAYVDRPKPKVKVNRSFPLTFRVDSNWEIYKALVEQKSYTSVFPDSFVATDIETLKTNSLLFNVDVLRCEMGTSWSDYHSTGKLDTNLLYKFRYCWIDSITPDGFENGGDAKPINVTCQIHFLEMYDSASGFPGEGSTSSLDFTGKSAITV